MKLLDPPAAWQSRPAAYCRKLVVGGGLAAALASLPAQDSPSGAGGGSFARVATSGERAMSEVKTRVEVHKWILTQVRQRPACQDFSQEFRLLGNGRNWECIPTNCYDWDRDSLETFDQVVREARRRFDLQG